MTPIALMTTYKKWEILHALVHFLSSYHSGQFSKGYRYLGITLQRLRQNGEFYPIDRIMSHKEARLYRYFVRHYKEKV